MDKKRLTIVLVVVLASSSLVWYFISRNNVNDQPTAGSQQSSKESPQNKNTEPSDDITPPAIEEADLIAVNNYKGTGVATRTISGEYIHNVTANISAPAEGKFYEGWIVGPEGFISTGKLTQETEGSWSVVYVSNDNLASYNQVVITEETKANGLDNKPEAHVLEGKF